MPRQQVIATTVFGPKAESIAKTFASFTKVPHAELHVFVFNETLPQNRHPQMQYHLVEHDPSLISVRRDALFRRWILPDQLDAEYGMVVDGTDAICLHPLPPFKDLLGNGIVAAAPEWLHPVRLLGQGFTSSYLNAGMTLWHLPASRQLREEIVSRGRSYYRGPYDDQIAINEVVQTKYFDRLTILAPQYNWRALFKKSFRGWQHKFRSWPRLDSLDGVQIYHNQHCVDEVLAAMNSNTPRKQAGLPAPPGDHWPLSKWELKRRQAVQWWMYS